MLLNVILVTVISALHLTLSEDQVHSGDPSEWSEWSCVHGSWRRSVSATQFGGKCGGQVLIIGVIGLNNF